MEFVLTPEQEAFRREVRAYLQGPHAQELLRKIQKAAPREEVHPDAIFKELGGRGWLTPDWPVEYGGLGLTAAEGAIFLEEYIGSGLPYTAYVSTIDIVGQFLLHAGSDAQKREFLPRMASGELLFSVLYTEPKAGSDLASLHTRAEWDGNAYRLYGTKIYNMKTNIAHYAVCAARTRTGKTKYDGITIFIVPLQDPAVDVRPLWNMTDERFHEVVLDGVAVPPERIIGTLHGGWGELNQALTIERTGLEFNAKAGLWLNRLTSHAKESGQTKDQVLSRRLVDLHSELTAGRLLAWRAIEKRSRHEFDEYASSISKWYNSELCKKIARFGLEMEGIEGTLSRWDGAAPIGGLIDAMCREAPGLTLSAGTSEIMLYLISSGLGSQQE